MKHLPLRCCPDSLPTHLFSYYNTTMIALDIITGFLTGLGRLTAFSLKSISAIFKNRPQLSLIIEQMFIIGVKTLPVLAAVCIFVGTNVAIVGYQIFKQFGGQDFIGGFVALSCIREMAPILTGAIMAAKPGTDIAATISTMKVKEQIDALEVMSVNPFTFLITPRIIAFVAVAPILVIFADFLCVASAYLVSVYQLDVNPGKFYNDVVAYTEVSDFFKGMFKGTVSALLVCLISCYYGYTSEPGPTGVSKAINTSVVIETSLVIVVNYFLTEFLYGFN